MMRPGRRSQKTMSGHAKETTRSPNSIDAETEEDTTSKAEARKTEARQEEVAEEAARLVNRRSDDRLQRVICSIKSLVQ